jgi:DNA-binding transcriptional ArsR family regulator
MAEQPDPLDDTFLALADPTRRAILSRLGQGPASVGELAAPFDMALTSFMKHLKILERAGWIATRKSGRVRTCAIVTDRFADVGAWVYGHRALWENRQG